MLLSLSDTIKKEGIEFILTDKWHKDINKKRFIPKH